MNNPLSYKPPGKPTKPSNHEAFEQFYRGREDKRLGRPEKPPSQDEELRDWYFAGYLPEVNIC